MLRFIIKRLLILPLLLLLFTIIVFAMVQAPPGDFLTSYVAMLASSGSSMDAAQVEALKQQFGLDKPIHIQYLRWMESIFKGNFGLSLEYQRPNSELIGERLAVTVFLALFAFVITWLIAIPAGIYSAMHKNSFLDYLFALLNYIGIATPNFMLALILMWIAFSNFGLMITGLFSPEFGFFRHGLNTFHPDARIKQRKQDIRNQSADYGQKAVNQKNAARQVHILLDQGAQEQWADVGQVHNGRDDQAA